ncbi:MAG: PilZ domain-containing protein [Deltaproteobacteria bacterium]|nr:PilZ domain-containing protein [Deltaproteobacteria bacterium]
MDETYWEGCPYYAEDECPHSSLVDRTYLVPHLLSSKEVEEAKAICGKCGLYLSEKRKYFRLKRPFRVVVTTGIGEEKFRGRIANVSGVGALVTFKDWPDFVLDQKVEIAIYSRRKDSTDLDETVTKVTGEVKRIDAKDKQAAVMFLEEVKPEFLLAP